MSWFQKKSPSLAPPSAPTISAEVEAYLQGSYAALRRNSGAWLPGWAWLNTCAHGDLKALQAIARTRPSNAHGEDLTSWRGAEQIIAADLLDIVAEDDILLLQIQQEVLIPLELDLIAHGEVLSPSTLVLGVRAALRSCLS